MRQVSQCQNVALVGVAVRCPSRGESPRCLSFHSPKCNRELKVSQEGPRVMVELKIHTSGECGYRNEQRTWEMYQSLFQGAIATTLTQPLDVCKTRAMNAKPGEFKGESVKILRFSANV